MKKLKELLANVLPRPIYLNRISPFIGKNIIKVITGQRRVGKSYLLYQTMDDVREKYPDANSARTNPKIREIIVIALTIIPERNNPFATLNPLSKIL